MGTAWGHLPEVAAGLGGLWYLIQICDYFYIKYREWCARKDDPT